MASGGANHGATPGRVSDMPAPEILEPFRAHVLEWGRALYRDLPWRRTRDPYAIWISEVMLQQTQVSRVDGRWQRWLERFPGVDALAAASTADVLDEWQGLGYNRRALALHRAAQTMSEAGGTLPADADALVRLPGIGPATAAGIRAFAHNLHAVYLETNVRAVFLHELYPDAAGVPDAELIPLVDATCPPDGDGPEAPGRTFSPSASDLPRHDMPFGPAGGDGASPDHGPGAGGSGVRASGDATALGRDDPRTWYYALLDYGAHLKRTVPNPSRRSATHARQSRFEGSRRQKRAMLVRALLSHRGGAGLEELAEALSIDERRAGRDVVDERLTESLLLELASEGFCQERDGLWVV